MDYPQVDFFAVFVATIASTLMGMIWYSKKLFGPTWSRLTNVHLHSKWPLLWTLCTTLLTACLLGFFEALLGVSTVLDGMVVGALAWLGFSATTYLEGVIWGRTSFRLFLIDEGFDLLSYLTMGGVLGA